MKFLKSLIFLFILNVFKNTLKNFRNVKPLGREGLSSLMGVEMSDKGVEMSDKGVEMSDKGVEMSDKGVIYFFHSL